MTFYDVLVGMGSTHTKIVGGGYSDGLVFDLRNKSVRTRDKYLMKDGNIIPQNIMGIELSRDMELISETDNPYDVLEMLYKTYKTSIPNEYSGFVKNNFKAKSINELTYDEFAEGNEREISRIKLEAFVLLTNFPWENEKHHYWQSSNDKDLIIYKEWR